MKITKNILLGILISAASTTAFAANSLSLYDGFPVNTTWGSTNGYYKAQQCGGSNTTSGQAVLTTATKTDHSSSGLESVTFTGHLTLSNFPTQSGGIANYETDIGGSQSMVYGYPGSTYYYSALATQDGTTLIYSMSGYDYYINNVYKPEFYIGLQSNPTCINGYKLTVLSVIAGQ